jgi:hypothetical protein
MQNGRLNVAIFMLRASAGVKKAARLTGQLF